MYRDVVGAVDELAWMRYKTTFRTTLALPHLRTKSPPYELDLPPRIAQDPPKGLAPNHMRDEKQGGLPLWENFRTHPLTKISSDGYVASLSPQL